MPTKNPYLRLSYHVQCVRRMRQKLHAPVWLYPLFIVGWCFYLCGCVLRRVLRRDTRKDTVVELRAV